MAVSSSRSGAKSERSNHPTPGVHSAQDERTSLLGRRSVADHASWGGTINVLVGPEERRAAPQGDWVGPTQAARPPNLNLHSDRSSARVGQRSTIEEGRRPPTRVIGEEWLYC